MPFRRIAKPATGSTTRRIRACRHEAERGAFKFRASGRASIPAKSARAALCCAGVEPAACGIAEL
eukprot:1012858-Pleurochrysis_carterae.AAC.1